MKKLHPSHPPIFVKIGWWWAVVVKSIFVLSHICRIHHMFYKWWIYSNFYIHINQLICTHQYLINPICKLYCQLGVNKSLNIKSFHKVNIVSLVSCLEHSIFIILVQIFKHNQSSMSWSTFQAVFFNPK